MKIAKRILGFALSFTIAASCLSAVVFADETATTKKGSFPDVEKGQIYTDAVSTLNLMGIINGYEDGKFLPDNNVTRAEFTAMLMRTLKLGNMGSKTAAELPFSDIDDNNSDINWAIPDINTAYSRGTINGYEDGTFRPNDNVAFEEAVKMVVCTLGYGDNVDVSVTPWYANYISIANQIGIIKNASKISGVETPATRACIAQLLYDALSVELVENNEKTDKTILDSYLGYKKATGVVASNGRTSLTSPDVNLRENEVMINAADEDSAVYETHTYAVNDETIKDMLGTEIEFYYKEDGTSIRNLAFYITKGSEPLVINAKNIENSTSGALQIKYYENLNDSKEKVVNLESDNVVIYNGKLYGATAGASRFNTSLIPSVGEIKLIDSDSNGKYDIVDITSYQVYYVSSKVASTYDINDNVVSKGSTVKLNTTADPNLSIVNKNGTSVNFSSIGTGNIVCVAKSNSGNGTDVITRAVVVTDKISGTVSGTRSDKVTISGKEYGFSAVAPWITMGDEAPGIQDIGTFYLDINGDIVAFSKNSANLSTKYGYVLSYSENSDSFETDVMIRVRTSSDSEERIWTYKNTIVNNETVSDGQAVIDKLKLSANPGATDANGIQQVIKYTTKTVGSKKVFDRIITAENILKGQEVVSDELTRLNTVDPTETFTYNSSSKKLTNSGGDINISIGSAIVFTVPDDRTDYDKFRKRNYSDIYKNGVSSYKIEVYDVSGSNSAKVIVALEQDSSQAVNSASPVYVLRDNREEYNDSESSAMTMFKGFKASPTGSGTEFSEWISTTSNASLVAGMQTGDIYRSGVDSDGFATIGAADILYKFGEDNSSRFVVKKETTGSSNPDLRLEDYEFVSILGSVTAKDEEGIAVKASNITQRDADYSIGSDDITFSISDFSNAMVIIYDTTVTQENMLVRESDAASVIAGLTPVQDGNPSKVLIYMSEGKIKLLCILPQE